MASKAEPQTGPGPIVIDGDNNNTIKQGHHRAAALASAAVTPGEDTAENVIQGEFGIPKGGIKAATVRRTEVLHIDPRRFQIEPGWNTRNMQSADTREHIKGIQASASEILPDTSKPRGIVTPLTFVQKGNAWVIRSGHCRWTAVMAAIKAGVDIPTIPVMRASDSELEQAISQFTDNNGLPFTPIERGAHYKMLRDKHGMDITEIGKAIGKTASHVSQCIGYHDALTPHADIMEMIETGYVSVAFAKDIFDENEGDTELALYILRGAVEIAMEKGANKAMPKHARLVLERHRQEHPEVYADEGAEGTEGADAGTGATTEAGAAEAPAGKADTPASTGKGGSGGGKTPAVATKAGGASAAPPTLSRNEAVDVARDEICTDLATLMNRPGMRKKLYELFGDTNRAKVDRFIAGALQGKWELPR